MKRCSLALAGLVAGLLGGHYLLDPALHGQNPNPPAIPKEITSYRDVVKRVLPAVVSVEAKAKARPARGPMPQPFDAPRPDFGSGFVVDASGVILTNYHVVAGAEEVVVQFQDGRKLVSREVKGDRKTDLAIVRLTLKEGVKLPALELGDSASMEIGDRVLAVGAPFGLAGSVTHGIISGTGRNGLNLNMYEDFVQTDAAINPGNSGGPLVSLDGKVIGINAAIKSRSGGFQGVGLAVSSNLAKAVVKALLTDGVVRRGYLGVQIRDLAPEVAERLGLPRGTGVVVGEVYEKTPASKAGLKEGDVIATIAGEAIRDGRGLQTVVAGLPLNKAANVEVLRDGKKQMVPVVIEEQPEEFGAARPPERGNPAGTAVEKLGLVLADLTEALAAELGYKGVRGVVLAKVEANGVGAQAGLRPGMVIAQVDRRPVADAVAARAALEAGSLKKGILLQVRSPQGGANFVLLQAGG